MTLEELKEAVKTAAAIRYVQCLQPVGGAGDKVFPPTYAGGVYAVENRRINRCIDGEVVPCVVPCVLLDSVQSQANRMEEALQDAFLPNWRELPEKAAEDQGKPESELPVVAVHVENHGWVTSLTAPHRIHDAILRDSKLNGTRFRDSEIGKAVVKARVWNATAFYKHCPTALLFGTWDSTAGEGLDSAKIPRAIVSEIVGVDITPGVRTGSRIDPLGIKAQSATVYRRTDKGWALKDGETWIGASENEVEKDKNGNPKRFGKGKPSDINHGNVTPDMPRFERDEIRNQGLDRLPNILEANPVKLRYEVSAGDGRLKHALDYNPKDRIRDGAMKPGGVTMDRALHTWTLSLTQLRRLRFPGFETPNGEKATEAQNEAARTVLAALGLYALALQQERGAWLRSRCELYSEEQPKVEIIGAPGGEIGLGSAADVRKQLLDKAIGEAQALGVGWEKSVLRLTPTAELAKLVELSDARRPDAEEDASDQAAADAVTEG